MKPQHPAHRCVWAEPTLLLPPPFWLEAWACPWSCVVQGDPQPLETTDVCRVCPWWLPRRPSRSDPSNPSGSDPLGADRAAAGGSGTLAGRAGPAAERSLFERSLEDLLGEAVRFHGHECPGVVLGVRMTLAGCRGVRVERPRAGGKGFLVIVEIDRCATDAIEALTGVSLGKRTLRLADYGKMAATFVDARTGLAVRVAAREEARALARARLPREPDARRAQAIAYRVLPDRDLLVVTRVAVRADWLARRRTRVPCAGCGEGVSYEREVRRDGRALCRACAEGAYYVAVD